MKIKYNPNKYNKDKYTLKSHNCYAYVLNKKSKKNIEKCKDKKGKHCLRPQVGNFKTDVVKEYYYPSIEKKRTRMITCPRLKEKIKTDNPNISFIKKKCNHKDNYQGIVFNVEKSKKDKKYYDYHFYRRDDNGYWSHKYGIDKATNKMDNNNDEFIKNPKLDMNDYCNNRNYKCKFCSYLCIPRDSRKKRMKIKY